VNAIIPLVCGALFSAGICLAGMVRPSKVIGFLDFAGAWDATLLVVMTSALSLHVVAWQIVKRLRAPRLGGAFPGPPSSVIDARLVGGAALFGIGWGLSGYCPGPAIVSLVSGATASVVFVGAMLAAMLGFDRRRVGPAADRIDDTGCSGRTDG
jgi:uncharacterized membrane protein YedE/YeeE